MERRPTNSTLRSRGTTQRRAMGNLRTSGPRPTWVDQYKPTESNLHPDVIRVLDASYVTEIPSDDRKDLVKITLPWWCWTEHWDNTHEKSSVCSAGPWRDVDSTRAQPCRGCELYRGLSHRDPTTGKMKAGAMSCRSMYSFSVIHYHPYHRVEQFDEDGNIKKNNKGETFYQWVKCEIDGCPHCAAGKLMLPARKLHWDMGINHYDTLLSKDEALRLCCKNCKTRSSIAWDVFACSNVECGHPFFERGKTCLKEVEVLKTAGSPMLCPVCGNYSQPNRYDSCTKCGDNPSPATLFDVVLHVHRESSTSKIGTELKIDDWEEGYEGVFVPPEIAAFDPEMAKNFHVPLDLPKLIPPTDIQMQNKLFGVGGPGAPDWKGPPATETGRQPMVASEYAKR